MNGPIKKRRENSPGKSSALEAWQAHLAIPVFQHSTCPLLPPGVGQIAGVVLTIFGNFENLFGRTGKIETHPRVRGVVEKKSYSGINSSCQFNQRTAIVEGRRHKQDRRKAKLPAKRSGRPSSNFAWSRRSFPLLGKSFPDLGKSFPCLGKSFPCLGKSLPNLGKSFPCLGKSLPNPGKSFPRNRKDLPHSV
jgi:hypothetical protein